MSEKLVKIRVLFEYVYELNPEDYPDCNTIEEMYELDSTTGFLCDVVPKSIGFEVVDRIEKEN